jgi:hypothetical protein
MQSKTTPSSLGNMANFSINVAKLPCLPHECAFNFNNMNMPTFSRMTLVPNDGIPQRSVGCSVNFSTITRNSYLTDRSCLRVNTF